MDIKTPEKISHSKELLRLENPDHETLPCLKISEMKPKFPIPNNLPPSSDVLRKVKEFLPVMAKANEVIKDVDSDLIDIENVDDYTGPVVEMNFAFVDFDGIEEESEVDGDSSESCDSEDDSEDEETSELTTPTKTRATKMLVQEVLNTNVLNPEVP